jgi:hypothetical protein
MRRASKEAEALVPRLRGGNLLLCVQDRSGALTLGRPGHDPTTFSIARLRATLRQLRRSHETRSRPKFTLLLFRLPALQVGETDCRMRRMHEQALAHTKDGTCAR